MSPDVNLQVQAFILILRDKYKNKSGLSKNYSLKMWQAYKNWATFLIFECKTHFKLNFKPPHENFLFIFILIEFSGFMELSAYDVYFLFIPYLNSTVHVDVAYVISKYAEVKKPF